MTIDVIEDGHDQLSISGSTLQWSHLGSAFVNGNTTINASYDSTPVIVNATYINGATGTKTDGVDPNSFSIAPFALARISQTVQLTPLVGPPLGGFMLITQQPSAGNNYTTILDFNDQIPGGTHEYKAQLTFTGVVPEPATTSMMSAGLIGLGFAFYRRRKK